MKLNHLLPIIAKNKKTIANFEIEGISCNSKEIKNNYLFVAIKGSKDNGEKYIDEAIRKGARVIVRESDTESYNSDSGILYADVKNARKKLAEIAAIFYGHPSQDIKVIGITGTNGKTTTSFLIESILKEAKQSSGVIGTVSYKYKDKILPATNTTPDALRLQSFLSDMVKQNIKYCVMEVTSHALDQDRVANINFSSAIFTNLTQDHLDYHKTLEKYFLAKQKLFEDLSKKSWAIINGDDLCSDRLFLSTKAKRMRYGIKGDFDIKAKDIKLILNSSEFNVSTPEGEILIQSKFMGIHNVYNILASVGFGIAEGLNLNVIKRGIERLENVPGRLEPIDCGQAFKVFVDYAHTEDALDNALSTLRRLNKEKIIVVFGCGGDRDKGKRPKMGQVAAKLSDFIILTSDNPRSEDPRDIVRDVSRGITTKNYKVVLDRESAIQEAINLAKDKDAVLIAGKGHEPYQIFGDKVIPFDDRKIAMKILKCLR